MRVCNVSTIRRRSKSASSWTHTQVHTGLAKKRAARKKGLPPLGPLVRGFVAGWTGMGNPDAIFLAFPDDAADADETDNKTRRAAVF